MREPKIGQIVHYILQMGPQAGKCRPAIVVRITETLHYPVLSIFVDGRNDGPSHLFSSTDSTVLGGPLAHDLSYTRMGTWHFAEECPHEQHEEEAVVAAPEPQKPIQVCRQGCTGPAEHAIAFGVFLCCKHFEQYAHRASRAETMILASLTPLTK